MRNNSSLAEVVKGVLTSTTDDITPLVRLVFADEYEAVPQPFILGSDTSSTAHHTGTTSHPAASEDREAQARSTLESMLEMLADLAETKEQEVHQLHKCADCCQPNGSASLCLHAASHPLPGNRTIFSPTGRHHICPRPHHISPCPLPPTITTCPHCCRSHEATVAQTRRQLVSVQEKAAALRLKMNELLQAQQKEEKALGAKQVGVADTMYARVGGRVCIARHMGYYRSGCRVRIDVVYVLLIS